MRSVSPGCLVDTNVLVYAYDPREAHKGWQALAVLDELQQRGLAVTSAQILGEFYVSLRRLLDPALAHEEATERALYYANAWPVCEINGATVQEALRAVSEFRLSYWDALIWATARHNRLPLVLSEDFQDGRLIEGVLFRNPFAEGFRLANM